jgi:hypothetical protein
MLKKTTFAFACALAAFSPLPKAWADISIQAFNTSLVLPLPCSLPARRSLTDQIVFVCGDDEIPVSMSVYVAPAEKCLSILDGHWNEVAFQRSVLDRQQLKLRPTLGDPPIEHWFVWNSEVCVHALSSDASQLAKLFAPVWE